MAVRMTGQSDKTAVAWATEHLSVAINRAVGTTCKRNTNITMTSNNQFTMDYKNTGTVVYKQPRMTTMLALYEATMDKIRLVSHSTVM